MPELMLSALDLLFILAAIAAAVWFGYLVWQNWLRNQPFFSRRLSSSLSFLQPPRPVDRVAPRYAPTPTRAERLEPPPEMSRQIEDPLQAVSKSKAAIKNTLLRNKFYQLREEIRLNHPDQPEEWVLQEVWKRLEAENLESAREPHPNAGGEQNPLE